MIIIGEKINGSIPSVAEAVANRDAEFIKDRARKQAEANATFIDCCASVSEEQDDSGIPKNAADRLRVFDKIMAKAKEYGISPSRIHIDPLVEMLCTSENGIETNIEVISTVREKYPSIHITAAISNISFNLPVRKLINLGFVVLAMNAGLDSGILDPTNRDMLGLIYAASAAQVAKSLAA